MLIVSVPVLALIIMIPLQAEAQEPYQAQVGNKQVTSVTRPITKGAGPSRDELLQAARTAVPLTPSNPPRTIPSIGAPSDGVR